MSAAQKISAGSDTAGDDGTPAVPAYVERRENCPRYTFAGGIWIVLADLAQTRGNIANLESVYANGGGLPRRIHEREEEMAYVVSGRLRVRIGEDAETTAEPGALVFVPRGTARKLTADADDTRVYHGFVPAGIEQLIIELGAKTEEMTTLVDAPALDVAKFLDYGVHIIAD